MSELFPVVILAGGLATRMRPYAEGIPKALIDIEGKPFLGWQLELLAGAGVRRVVICVGHLGGMIQEYAGNGARFGLEVVFSYDGDQLLGTGGAIRKSLPLSGPQFFVLYGDSYLECDYAAIQRYWLNSGKSALMTVYRNDDQFDRSNVEYRNGDIVAYDKGVRSPAMRHIDYGLGMFCSPVFERLPANTVVDLAAVYRELVAEGQLAAFEVPRRFYEIGSPEGLAAFRIYAQSMRD